MVRLVDERKAYLDQEALDALERRLREDPEFNFSQFVRRCLRSDWTPPENPGGVALVYPPKKAYLDEPSLRAFEARARFPGWNFSHFVREALKGVTGHWQQLR